jgi:hypothetical protein
MLRLAVVALVLGGAFVHGWARHALTEKAAGCGDANASACRLDHHARRNLMVTGHHQRLGARALVARRANALERDDDATYEPRRRRLIRSANASTRAGGARAHREQRTSGRSERSDPLGWRALCLPHPTGVATSSAAEGGAADAARGPSSEAGVCVHKELLVPGVEVVEVLAMALVFAVAALALASGIGGGGIYVPALNLILRFKPHVAVGLSQALICGGAIGALAVNARSRHPLATQRPLVDCQTAPPPTLLQTP